MALLLSYIITFCIVFVLCPCMAINVSVQRWASPQQYTVLSTCPLHTNSGCGKERRILIGPWWPAKAALVRNYLEVYWPCVGGLSVVNAIGTQLRDPINSGLTRWRMAVSQMDAAAELGRNPVSKHQVQSEYEDEQADAGRDGWTRLARPNSQARTGTGEYSFLSLNRSRGRSLAYCCIPRLYWTFRMSRNVLKPPPAGRLTKHYLSVEPILVQHGIIISSSHILLGIQ